VVSSLEWKVVITFILWKETAMRQVQLHKAMLMQEVQQLKSANVPKIEAYRRLNAEAKKISWPTFLKYYNADEVPSAKSISGNYEKQKVFDVEPFRKEIMRCLEANRDNKDLKVSSIYDLLEELYVDLRVLYGLAWQRTNTSKLYPFSQS